MMEKNEVKEGKGDGEGKQESKMPINQSVDQ